jgi:hypothetical protein
MPRRAAVPALVALLAAGTAVPASAQEASDEYSYRPFELALFSPVHIFHPENKIVAGLSLVLLYGNTNSVYGIELGAGVNWEDEDMIGLQVGSINIVDDDALILQFGALWNWVGDWCGGLCYGTFLNRHGRLAGIQLSPILNLVEQDGGGLQVGSMNWTKGTFYGLQISPFNWNGGVRGVSLGLGTWNEGSGVAGLQIHMVNFVLGTFDGIQIGPIMNTATLDTNGLQLGLVNLNQFWSQSVGSCGYDCEIVENTTYFNTTTGVQLGGGNVAWDFVGLRVGALNLALHDADSAELGAVLNWTDGVQTGVQLGAVNYAAEVHGVQVGAINVCGRLKGLQLGALNIAYDSPLPFMVVANAGW